MRILEALAELVAPTRCTGCELPGDVLCERCAALSASIDLSNACPRCGAPHGRLVCTECWNAEFAFEAALCAGEFAAPLARVVALHKDGPERRVGDALGAILGRRVCEQWPEWTDAVTWVPAAPAALRRRGFDHAHGIAKAVGREIGSPCVSLLQRCDAVDQRRLGRAERARNVRGTFTVNPAEEIAPHVLLVDDVFTTGATLDAAAIELLEAGVGAVRVAAVARTW